MSFLGPRCTCGGYMMQIKRGGCGGRGAIYRCIVCNRLYEQKTGGIISTEGGEKYRALEPWEIRVKGLATEKEEFID